MTIKKYERRLAALESTAERALAAVFELRRAAIGSVALDLARVQGAMTQDTYAQHRALIARERARAKKRLARAIHSLSGSSSR